MIERRGGAREMKAPEQVCTHEKSPICVMADENLRNFEVSGIIRLFWPFGDGGIIHQTKL